MSPQHEHSAVLAAIKLIALALLLGAIGGLAYYVLEMVEGTNGTEVTEAIEDMEESEAKEDWQQYENETLDVFFEYPLAWGKIEETREEGIFGDDYEVDEEGTVLLECETHVELGIGDERDRIVFLVADDNADCGTLGRGGYWGDYADQVTSVQTLADLCFETRDGVCRLYTNTNGLTYAHVHFDSVESWGTVLNDVDEYYFFHEGHDWDGIVISDEFFVQSGFDQDAALVQLVESIEFQP